MNKINLIGINETIIHEKLPNGLDIYLLPNKHSKNFYITFSTKYGSIYTDFELDNKEYHIPNGIAHFLEHITFKMEDGNDASAIFADLGSDSNAYTSYKVTCYEVTSYSNFKDNLTNLLDFVQKPFYTNEIVEREKGIICEEIKMYDDSAGSMLNFEVNNCLFNTSNYKYKVAGECEDVINTTLDDINITYNTFYHPSNMFVIITGLFDPEEALNIIKENQANKIFKPQPHFEIITKKEPNNLVKNKSIIKYPVEIDKVCVALKIPKDNFKDLHLTDNELNTYFRLLVNANFGKSSLLREELVDNKIINNTLFLNKEVLKDHIIIRILAETKHKNKLIKYIQKQLSNLSISKEDFNRKKKVMISEYIQSFDDIEEVSYDIQNDLIEYNKIIDNYYEIYNNLDITILNKIIERIDTKELLEVVLTKGN